MLHVARDVFPQHDEAMDAFVFVLERLREDEHRRLRGFADDGRSKLTTWLAVVTRRLCLDFYRQQYGRARVAQNANAAAERLAARRRLVRLAGSDDVLIEQTEDQQQPLPDTNLQQRELRDAVTHALAQLPPEERLLIKLRFHDGLSGSEIAKLLGLPTAFHVFRRLNATFGSLRRLLRARGVESSSP
jgi:RNA polymerase sigma factor (sigma-70 family)